MKLNKIILTALLATLMQHIPYVHAEDRVVYHEASSEEEKALENILRFTETDDEFHDFILKIPGYARNNLKEYQTRFTQSLFDSVAKLERDEIKSKCHFTNPDYATCGLNYRPITCTQEDLATPYLFYTSKKGENDATIQYKADYSATTYRMVKKDGNWMLDEVRCH